MNERLDILNELDNEVLNLIPADKDIEHETDSAGVFRQSIHEVIVHIEVLEEYESKRLMYQVKVHTEREHRLK